MSTIAATFIALLLIVVAIAPLGAAYWKPAARLPATVFYALLLAGLALHYAGLSFAPVRPLAGADPSASLIDAAQSDEVAQRCGEALEAAERGSVIRDGSDPERLRVNRALWNQMPPYVREALIRCFEISHPTSRAGAGVEIVEE